jgi:hypothetical protein
MRPEIYGDNDDWETLSEVIKENGDDCEGLAMLTRQLMTDIGIQKNETYLTYMAPATKTILPIWLSCGRIRRIRRTLYWSIVPDIFLISLTALLGPTAKAVKMVDILQHIA